MMPRVTVTDSIPIELLTRLGYEILPYLRELDDHEWTAEEREFLESSGTWKTRPLSPVG
ncbi:MAG TPA: hypothetical protein VKT83_18115 [bacterium]|nr:hypothetical protein [bacterium]